MEWRGKRRRLRGCSRGATVAAVAVGWRLKVAIARCKGG